MSGFQQEFWDGPGSSKNFTHPVEAVVRMHGGVKFYRGAANAALAHVEHDRSRADDYYLGEGTGVAVRLPTTPRVFCRPGS